MQLNLFSFHGLRFLSFLSFFTILCYTYKNSGGRLALYSYAGIPRLPFFEELLNAQDYDYTTGFIRGPFTRKGRQILPVIRPITYKFNSVQGGFLHIEISSDLFTDALKRYAIAEDSLVLSGWKTKSRKKTWNIKYFKVRSQPLHPPLPAL